jgi:tRNA (cytidine/uridine-2'-O-)-methyltransferase
VVLVAPRIPQNTGNVARLCAATNSALHLVRPLGFRLDDRAVRRAGLDYWQYVTVHVHRSFDELTQAYQNHSFYFATKQGKILYSDVRYTPDDFLVFGSETHGLPAALLEANRARTIRVPILNPAVRSLNLATTVAITLYEALRQLGHDAATYVRNKA